MTTAGFNQPTKDEYRYEIPSSTRRLLKFVPSLPQLVALKIIYPHRVVATAVGERVRVGL